MKNPIVREIQHHDLGEEVRSIGGQYTLTKEERLVYDNREVLYVIGFASLDTSCCGTWGSNYAMVLGYIKEWKIKKSKNGRDISRVETITRPNHQSDIRELIMGREKIQDLWFV
jgi:hypothetical protein